jgi:hypothetical protein
MAALGIDIAGVDDVDLFLSYAEPGESAAQAVARSLLHDPGKLWWAPDSGHNINRYLHTFFEPERAQSGIQQQAELEERVAAASVQASRLGDEMRVQVNLTLEGDESQVQMTLAINALGEVLDASISV